MNFLKAIWDWAFYFGEGELYSYVRFGNYLGKTYFLVYGVIYILDIAFILVLNYFVKMQRVGKGYHFLIILLSFLPVANLFLFYIIKRKLNKQLFAFSGMDSVRSDRKISAVWVLMILFIIYTFLIPLLVFFVLAPELASGAAYYSHVSIVVTDCCFLTTSLIWLFYYFEFKQILNKIELNESGIGNTQLLDN